MKPTTGVYDVVVVGAGISGLGAALTLQQQGFKVCVLEKCERVGGRMTTDRVNGFAIDRGVTIFGSQFQEMRRLVKQLGLQPLLQWFPFSFGLRSSTGQMTMGRTRLVQLMLGRQLSWKTKLAMVRFTLDVLRLNRKLNHGHSAEVAHLDTESTSAYMKRIGGEEFLEKVLKPGLNGPFGGALESNSKLILFQTFWNILLLNTWAIRGGIDRILEAMAKRLEVVTHCSVENVELGTECSITVRINGVPSCLRAKGVIFAIPGNLIPSICAELPSQLSHLLGETSYSRLTSTHVMFDRLTATKVTALGMERSYAYGHEIELEHNRVKNLCPEGQGVASIYFWDDAEQQPSQKSDEVLNLEARQIATRCFPECGDHILGIHILRWKEGIARFTPGRLRAMVALRQEMAKWQRPLQLCGDYLDGISSEGSLVTGLEAGRNMSQYLKAHSR